MAPRRPSKGKRDEWDRRREEDAVAMILVQEVLGEPGLWNRIKPEARDAMLRRFLELLMTEAARRPAFRPKDPTGQLVENLRIACGSLQRAVALATKIRGLPVKTVQRRHREFMARQRAAESTP